MCSIAIRAELKHYFARFFKTAARANTVNKVVTESINFFCVAVATRAGEGLKTCGCTSSRGCNALIVRVTGCCYFIISVFITTLRTGVCSITCICTSGSSYNRLIIMITINCAHCEIVGGSAAQSLIKSVKLNSLLSRILIITETHFRA